MIPAITTVLIMLLPCVLLAQGYPRTERLTTEQGLSQSIVYSIFQDREGFLWFGTRDGLNRYDGHRFMVFRADPFDSTAFAGTSVTKIAQDADGNLWLKSLGGLSRLDRRTFRFARVKGNAVTDEVPALQGDRWGNLWIGTEKGLIRYNTRTGAARYFHVDSADPSALSGDSIESLYEDRSGTLWVGTDGPYLHRYNPDREDFTRFDPGLPRAEGVHCLGEDSRGILYCAAVISDPVRVVVTGFDRTSGVPVHRIVDPGGHFYLPRSYIQPFHIDAFDGLWVRIRSWLYTQSPFDRTRLYRFPLYGTGAKLVLPSPDQAHMDRNVWAMTRDRSGITWIGTDNGATKLILHEPRFRTYRNIPGDEGSLSNDRVRGICKDRFGTLWVGTDGGLSRLDSGSRRWVRFAFTGEGFQFLHSNVVNAVFEDNDGALLIGTNHGWGTFDRRTNTFPRIGGFDPPPWSQVWSFCRDSSGILWIGTRSGGIQLYDRGRRFVRQFQPRKDDATTIAPGVVWDIHCDRQGTVWIATSVGLYRWVPGRRMFHRYGTYPEVANGLGSENVCAIMEDTSGVLWFSTYGGGLNRYDRRSDSFTRITTRNGLPSNVLYGALMDRTGRLWISSNTGLAAYDPVTGACRVYNAGDGLQSNEFSFKSFHKTREGELIFGGIRGLNIFHPDSLRISRNEAPVVVTEFRVFDGIVRRELMMDDTVEIAYDQSFISFEFAMLDYMNPAGNRYAYRMMGFDNAWINCGDRRYASFTNLDPGTYTFMVKGANSDGIWSPQPLRVVLKVIPPFWMTWWFKSLIVLGLLLAGGSAILLWVRSVRAKEALRRRSVESQLQTLRLQVNPHFIFNALSSIQHLILSAEPDRAVEYLSEFSALVRAVLENSEHTSIPLADEIATLRNYLHLEMFRFEGKFQYTIDVDPSIDIHRVSIPTMLIQPCVENAIRHGLLHKVGEGNLKITITGRGDVLHCSIEDDGVGRQRAGELRPANGHHGRSMGIRVTEERLNILNAASLSRQPISMKITDLRDVSGAPAGTRVELCIPTEFT